MRGRDDQAKRIRAVASRIAEGTDAESNGGVLLVFGEAGTGKSRMAAELARAAGEAGARVLSGATIELINALPFAPFVEAWTEHLRFRGRPAQENPFVAFSPKPGEAREDALRLFQAVERALLGDESSAPTVLIVEDLHWADASSLQLFHHLARATRTESLLLMGTCRHEEVAIGTPLHTMLSNLQRERLAERMNLVPLSEEDTALQVADLLEVDPEAEVVKQLFCLGGGNPLFTEELVQAHVERGADRTRPVVPGSLSDVVHERVARLGAQAEQLIRSAAAAGFCFSFEWVRRASGLAHGEALVALEALLHARLLDEDDAGYRFRHALVREALYEGLSRERRKVLHGVIADAIRATGHRLPDSDRDALLAHHLRAAGRPADALPHLLAAGEHAIERIGFQEARGFFERAIAVMDALEIVSGADRFHVERSLGMTHLGLANLDTAMIHFGAAVGLPAAEDGWRPSRDQRAEVFRLAGAALIGAGDLEQADRALADAMESAEEDGDELPHVLYNLAQLRWSMGRHQEAYDIAQRVVSAAAAREDDENIARGYEMLALACHSLGEWRAGIEFVEKRKEIVGDGVDVAEAFDSHL
jgi:predicted ATPase